MFQVRAFIHRFEVKCKCGDGCEAIIARRPLTNQIAEEMEYQDFTLSIRDYDGHADADGGLVWIDHKQITGFWPRSRDPAMITALSARFDWLRPLEQDDWASLNAICYCNNCGFNDSLVEGVNQYFASNSSWLPRNHISDLYDGHERKTNEAFNEYIDYETDLDCELWLEELRSEEERLWELVEMQTDILQAEIKAKHKRDYKKGYYDPPAETDPDKYPNDDLDHWENWPSGM